MDLQAGRTWKVTQGRDAVTIQVEIEVKGEDLPSVAYEVLGPKVEHLYLTSYKVVGS